MEGVEYSPGTVWIEQYAHIPYTLLRLLNIDDAGYGYEFFELGQGRSAWTHAVAPSVWEGRLAKGNYVEISPATWTLAVLKGTWDGTYERLPV